MKRFIAAAAAVLLFPLYAEAQKSFGADIGISSGIPVYGGTARDTVSCITDQSGFKRFIMGLNGDVFFCPAERIHLFTGADTLADFVWNGSEYSNHVSYAFLFGVKAYPFGGGFAASCAYALGSCSDYSNTGNGDEVSFAKWGNGFKLAVEYDFSKLFGKKYVPSAGFSYKFMPRGDNAYDNIFAAYLSFEL